VRSTRGSAWLSSWAAALLLLLGGAAQGGDRVYATPQDVEPLAPGSSVPSVRVETVRGQPVDLAEVVSERGALLVFYRGGW
jgi:hypothetical protein